MIQATLPIAAAVDVASYDLRPAAVRQSGARILRLLTTIIARRDAHRPVHQVLQAAWAPKRNAVGNVDSNRARLVRGPRAERLGLYCQVRGVCRRLAV